MQTALDSFPVGTKVCCTCKEEKSGSLFFKDGKQKDGLYRSCKACHAGRTKRWKQQNKDKVNAAATSRYAAKKDVLRPIQRAWEQANAGKIAVQRKQRYDADPETHRAKTYAQMRKNPERTKEIGRASYWNNHERALETLRRYKRENPARMKALEVRRRAAKLQAEPAWANEFFIEEAYRLAKLREKLCGGKWEVDHIVPLQSKLVCGLHVHTNLQVIPKSVNQSKSNRYWPDMP